MKIFNLKVSIGKFWYPTYLLQDNVFCYNFLHENVLFYIFLDVSILSEKNGYTNFLRNKFPIRICVIQWIFYMKFCYPTVFLYGKIFSAKFSERKLSSTKIFWMKICYPTFPVWKFVIHQIFGMEICYPKNFLY